MVYKSAFDVDSPDTLKMAFFLWSLSVGGMGFVCSKYKKGPCLSLFTAEGNVGFSTEHPGYLFIYLPNIWTALLWLSSTKAGSDVFCQQSTQRCSSNLCNSGTRWSPRKCRIPLHRMLHPPFEIPDPLPQNSEHIVAFLCLLYYTPVCEKEAKLFSCCIF